MTISEMHIWFRQYAQQMGMQNVRAILPEQIDVLINTAISEIVNQQITESIGTKNDRVVTDNIKLSQANALRSLYKIATIDEATTGDNKLVKVNTYDDGLYRVVKFITDKEESTIIHAIDKVLFLVDISVDYIPITPNTTTNPTKLFPIRIVQDSYLADTLNDFVLKPRMRAPIAVVYNDTLDVYFGENIAHGNGLLPSATIKPNQLRVSYIKKPNKVLYADDIGEVSVDCDLPESLHVDIVKRAADLYNISVSRNLYSNSQNQYAQNAELARSGARPVNEGYQN